MGILDRLTERAAPAAPSAPTVDEAAAQAAPPVWELLTSQSGSHLYYLNPDHVQSGLLDLALRPPRLVLDVGCYCGATGETIKRRWPGAVVVGIEPLAEAAALAAPRIDRVITGTLESVDFAASGLAPRSVDTIVLADVLEHMFNPWQALLRLRELLTDDGVVLASIPNVRNLNLIQHVVRGHWTYAGGGLLDITHIRFFTLAEVRRMFAETGFAVDAIAHNVDPSLTQLWDLAQQPGAMNLQLNALTIGELSAEDRRELATLQFYVRATKAGAPGG